MTTAVQQMPLRAAVAPDESVQRVPFGRLLRVELRKLVDTRAGFWLLTAIGIITVIAVTVYLFAADAQDLTFAKFALVTGTPQGFLLPVLAILTVTTEWTQRTGLVTFTLEPKRSRIVLAKLTAVVLIAVLAVGVAFAVAAIGNVAGAALVDGSGAWDISAGNVRDLFILQLLGVVQGFAFAMLLMNSAAALVLYFVLPAAWNILFSVVDPIKDSAPWLDLNTAIGPVTRGEILHGDQWAHLAVSGTIWVLVPLALGAVRLLRREVKSA